MICGHGQVSWRLETTSSSQTIETNDFTEEVGAREAFDDACAARRIKRAKLFMVVEIEASTHSKS